LSFTRKLSAKKKKKTFATKRLHFCLGFHATFPVEVCIDIRRTAVNPPLCASTQNLATSKSFALSKYSFSSKSTKAS